MLKTILPSFPQALTTHAPEPISLSFQLICECKVTKMIFEPVTQISLHTKYYAGNC